MIDFGPKRQEQECVEKTTSCKKKTRRGRPEKKPDYCKEKMIGDLIAKAVELFREPYDDRDVRAKDAPIRYVPISFHDIHNPNFLWLRPNRCERLCEQRIRQNKAIREFVQGSP